MSDTAMIVVLLAYASLFVELVFLHVPSVASSRSIFAPDADIGKSFSPKFRRIFDYSVMQKTLRYILPLVVVYALFAFPLIVLWIGHNPLDDNLFANSAILNLTGMSLVIAGRLLTFIATLQMRRFALLEPDQLRTTGTFRYSRNPGLVGMFLFVIGQWFNLPSFSMAIGIIVYIAYMHHKVCMEEDYLAQRYASEYAAYCRQTRRYLG